MQLYLCSIDIGIKIYFVVNGFGAPITANHRSIDDVVSTLKAEGLTGTLINVSDWSRLDKAERNGRIRPRLARWISRKMDRDGQ